MERSASVESDVITLGDLIAIVWRRKWLCLLIIGVFFLAGLVVTTKTTPEYSFSQTLVKASMPPSMEGYNVTSNPKALLAPFALEQFIQLSMNGWAHQAVQDEGHRLSVKVRPDPKNHNQSILTLTVQAPKSRLHDVQMSMREVLQAVNDYQAPLLITLQQSLGHYIDWDEQAIAAIQKKQRWLSSTHVHALNDQMPSPKKVIQAAKRSEVGSVTPDDGSVSDALIRIADLEETQLVVATVDLQQQLFILQKTLASDQMALSMIQPAYFMGEMQRSSAPTGLSDHIKLIMMTFLGVVVAVFLCLLLAFSGVRSPSAEIKD